MNRCRCRSRAISWPPNILATPLTKKIASFSRLLLYVILCLAAVTFLVGVMRGEKWIDMFMAVVALAVGLPAAVTITLAIGVSKMAQRNAIIRKLPAVETLGSTTIICSDKTGTLTQNQMTVQEIFAGGELYRVSGGGYAAEGDFTREGERVEAGENPALRECLVCGLFCNDSVLLQGDDGEWRVEGDPTEAALAVAARKSGLEREAFTLTIPASMSSPSNLSISTWPPCKTAARQGGGIVPRGKIITDGIR